MSATQWPRNEEEWRAHRAKWRDYLVTLEQDVADWKIAKTEAQNLWERYETLKNKGVAQYNSKWLDVQHYAATKASKNVEETLTDLRLRVSKMPPPNLLNLTFNDDEEHRLLVVTTALDLNRR